LRHLAIDGAEARKQPYVKLMPFSGLEDKEHEIQEATICNCTICRRYGALWAYGHDGNSISVEAPEGGLRSYVRSSDISSNFCRVFGNLVSWRGLTLLESGQTRVAVNLRQAEPEVVANVPLRRFDGLGFAT
jgi:hypothetical protein